MNYWSLSWISLFLGLWCLHLVLCLICTSWSQVETLVQWILVCHESLCIYIYRRTHRLCNCMHELSITFQVTYTYMYVHMTASLWTPSLMAYLHCVFLFSDILSIFTFCFNVTVVWTCGTYTVVRDLHSLWCDEFNSL